jgi:hypothetical protein
MRPNALLTSFCLVLQGAPETWEGSTVIAARRLLPLGAALMLGACVDGQPSGPAVIVVPGSGKDFAAFQQDDAICRSHAAANTGYGDLTLTHTQGSNAAPSGTTGEAGTAWAAGTTSGVGTAAGAPAGSGTPTANASGASTPEPPDETVPNQLGYLQCMAARGDTVRPEPTGYAETANWYGYGYPFDYAYPYGYGYPYGFYDVGFIGVFGGGFHRGFFHDGGFHRGFFHGGGFHRGGFHGGGFHGGGFHGGGSHGGGGHR